MGDSTSVKLSNCDDMDGETAFELLGKPKKANFKTAYPIVSVFSSFRNLHFFYIYDFVLSASIRKKESNQSEGQ